jgi:hypothetical protein
MAWLVLITQQTQAAKQVLRLNLPYACDCAWLPAFARGAVLLRSQLLRRDLACRAILIRIADLGPKRVRLVLLAFRGIEIGKIELRHSGGNCD